MGGEEKTLSCKFVADDVIIFSPINTFSTPTKIIFDDDDSLEKNLPEIVRNKQTNDDYCIAQQKYREMSSHVKTIYVVSLKQLQQ